MKHIAILLLIIAPSVVKCQFNDPETIYLLEQQEKEAKGTKNLDSMVSNTGFKIVKGNNLKIGVGTMPDGSFKYIRINSASLMRYSGGNPNTANSANAMPPSYSGLNFEVLKIQNRGSKKLGYVTYLVLKNADLVRYECDINNAIAAGEIEVPEQYKPKQKPLLVEIKNAPSVADELIKLKKLLDDGILTKDEFDAQKKKLLERKD